jgi:hypothetical protein
MPQEIRDTKSLSGYLKFPEGLPVAPVIITPVRRAKVAPGFVARPIHLARQPLQEKGEVEGDTRDGPVPVEASPVSSVTPEETGTVSPADTASSGAQDTDDDGEGGQQKQGQRVKIGLTAGPDARAGRRKGKGAAQSGSAARRDGELPLEEPTKGEGAGQAAQLSDKPPGKTAERSFGNTADGPGGESGDRAASGTERPADTAGAPSLSEQGARQDSTAPADRTPGKAKQAPTKGRDPDELDFDR